MKYWIFIFAIFAVSLHIVYWGATLVVIPFYLRRKALGWVDTPEKKLGFDLFNELYEGVNARSIAKLEHQRLHLKDDIFTYGEIEYIDFAKLLEVVNPQPGEVFVDLGSGSGKAVFAASILYPSIAVSGIELLPALIRLSEELLERFYYLVRVHQNPHAEAYDIEFIRGNILNFDFRDATIVFANATCYPEDFLDSVVEQLEQLAQGARVIIVSREIFSAYYHCIYEEARLMSWGRAVCRVYLKTV